MRENEEKREKQFRFILIILLCLLFGGIHIADPTFYSTIIKLSKDGNLQGTVVYLQNFGIWAVFVSFFIDVIINIVGFLPSIFLSTANGLIFGIFWGTVISWLAETTGVMISFFIMRTLFRNVAKAIIQKSKTLTKLDSYESWKAVMIARAIPYMPNGLVTAISALSSMTFYEHLLGSLIGKFPSVLLEVVLGHDIVTFKEHQLRLAVIIIVVGIVYGLIWLYMKNKKIQEKNKC